jgi:hypothetical protein
MKRALSFLGLLILSSSALAGAKGDRSPAQIQNCEERVALAKAELETAKIALFRASSALGGSEGQVILTTMFRGTPSSYVRVGFKVAGNSNSLPRSYRVDLYLRGELVGSDNVFKGSVNGVYDAREVSFASPFSIEVPVDPKSYRLEELSIRVFSPSGAEVAFLKGRCTQTSLCD